MMLLMRLSVILALSLLYVPCFAEAPVVRAPVNVATNLYTSCYVGLVNIEGIDTPTELNEHMSEIDETCLMWTAIWYREIMGTREMPQDMTLWPRDMMHRFAQNRDSFVEDVRHKLLYSLFPTKARTK